MKLFILVFALLTCFKISAVRAAPVTQTFEGILVKVPSGLAAEFPVGSRWTLNVGWDSASRAFPIFDNEVGYNLPTMVVTIEGVNGTWTTSTLGGVLALSKQDDVHQVSFNSGYEPENHTTTMIGDYDVFRVDLFLTDPTRTALSALEPAPGLFDLEDFSRRVKYSYLYISLDEEEELTIVGGLGNAPILDPEITVRERGRGYLSNGSGILKFRTTRVGRKAPKKTLLVGNAGLGTLTRLGTRFTGSARRDYTAIIRGARSVSPGASRQIDVTFKPKRRGTRTATLYVTSNDPADPNFRIKVSGKAIPAPKKR